MSIEPDTKDWTWVLERPCDECGFDAPGLDLARLPQALRDNANVWEVVLGTDDAAVRPSPHLWSPLEYAAHVRDVHRVFGERLARMLADDDPEFASWDQDAAAVEGDYLSQQPAQVAGEVVAAADAVAGAYEAVPDGAWSRPGRRSNGSAFTVDTLARYHLHDVVHHAHDVSHVTKRVTVASYDTHAEAYAEATAEVSEGVRRRLDAFAAALPERARVLEIGSAGGRDTRALAALGLSVRPTDVSTEFVRRLRAEGIEADTVDPLTDDLADPSRDEPYDGVWANASLLHIRREDLLETLARLAAATRPGGVLAMSVKEGDGARFSTHGSVQGPRHFTFWRESGLRDVLERAGWAVDRIDTGDDATGQAWLLVQAVRS